MTCKPNDFAAKANNRIDIQSFGLTADDYGGGDATWTSAGMYWAKIEPMSGREVFASEQLQSRVTHKILIRYQSGFADTKDFSKYRIVFDSRYFNIRYIRNLDKDMKREGTDFQEIQAEENAAIFA